MVRSWIEQVRSIPWRPLALSLPLVLLGLWFRYRQISYMHPGPALALIALGVAAGLVGWVLASLQRENADLAARQARADKQQARLTQQLAAAEASALQSIPPIGGLELLVNRWQPDRQGLDQDASALLFEQLRVALAVAREDFGGADALVFRRVFAGAKPTGGAFLIQHGNHNPLVLKLDSQHNIAEEIRRYREYVQQKLAFMPGEPRPCRGGGTLNGVPWGAITYTLIGTNSPGQLQTFGEYYAGHDAQAVCGVLTDVFKQLQAWWLHERPQAVESPYQVYARLPRKLGDFQQALRKLGRTLPIAGLQQISADTPELVLAGDLRLRNPLNWVQEVFGQQRLGGWVQQHYSSVVHGDFHMGNLLIESVPGHTSSWLIDFAHTGVGPTVRDLARLEADIACALMPIEQLTPQQMHALAASLLPAGPRITGLAPLPLLPSAGLAKGRSTIEHLRAEAQRYLMGGAPPPYYLALLHATLPMVAYRDRSPQQRLYALIASALLCECIEQW